MNPDRDQRLTEAMGKRWNENSPCKNLDFSTWTGFGLLWEWAKEQEWWNSFRHDLWYSPTGIRLEDLIDPDRLADAVDRFLWEYNRCHG